MPELPGLCKHPPLQHSGWGRKVLQRSVLKRRGKDNAFKLSQLLHSFLLLQSPSIKVKFLTVLRNCKITIYILISRRIISIHTLCPSWQELPKSTILIALLFGLQRSMFSGFKSQWIIFRSVLDKNINAVHICWANFLVKFKDTPRKLVFLNRS